MTLHENTLEPPCSLQMHISCSYKLMPAQDLSNTKPGRVQEKRMVAVLEVKTLLGKRSRSASTFDEDVIK
jgi:hypothetical protein